MPNQAKIQNPNSSRHVYLWISVLSSLSLLAGFLYSRALLSISIILLLANALLPQHIHTTIHRFKSNRFVWMSIAYFLLYIISYFWSEDKHTYWQVITLKLPFLLLPIGMLGLPYEDIRFKKAWIAGTLTMLLANVLFSIGSYIANPTFYIEGYAHSKQIPTTVYGDHIRFSLWLSINIVLLYWCWKREVWLWKSVKWSKVTYVGYTLIIIFFLHLLSAKTGLMTLYIVMAILGFHIISKKINLYLACLVAALLSIGFIIAAYYTIPTFRTKITYMKTQYDMVSQGKQLDYNYSDLGRIISYRVTKQAIHNQPWMGAGAGDLNGEMVKAYEEVHPEVPQDSRFVPINQYLTDVLGFGFVLSIIFWIMLWSGVRNIDNKYNRYSLLIALLMLASMMVEAMLQIQMGIMVYLYLTMIWYYWDDKSTTLPAKTYPT